MIALGGRKNKAQVGGNGVDGRIFPVSVLDSVCKIPGEDIVRKLS